MSDRDVIKKYKKGGKEGESLPAQHCHRKRYPCDKNKRRTFNIFMLNVFETKKGVL